jgi:hypothetical protein
VGIDGLPLGTKAVVVVDGAIVAELDLTSEGGRPLDLDGRIGEAVQRAAELVDRPVGVVRIALLDDRASGTTSPATSDRLAAIGLELEVIDLAGLDRPAPGAGGVESEASSESAGARSVARALLAALGPDADNGDPGTV